MDWNDYKELSIKTLNPELSFSEAIQNMAYGLIGEVGEVVDLLKKVRFHNHKPDKTFEEKLVKEIGDVCWYSSVLQRLVERTEVDKKIIPEFEPKDYTPSKELDTNSVILFIVSELHYATSLLFTVSKQLDKVTNPKAKDAILEIESIRRKLAYSYISTNRILYSCMDILKHWSSLYTIDDVLYENHKKLLKRYGGSFSTEKSVNRGA